MRYIGFFAIKYIKYTETLKMELIFVLGAANMKTIKFSVLIVTSSHKIKYVGVQTTCFCYSDLYFYHLSM